MNGMSGKAGFAGQPGWVCSQWTFGVPRIGVMSGMNGMSGMTGMAGMGMSGMSGMATWICSQWSYVPGSMTCSRSIHQGKLQASRPHRI